MDLIVLVDVVNPQQSQRSGYGTWVIVFEPIDHLLGHIPINKSFNGILRHSTVFLDNFNDLHLFLHGRNKS